MIEKVIRDYLEEQLGVPTRLEEESGLPEEYLLIEKTGGGMENHIKTAAIAIQSYSSSLYRAAKLNEKVKETMENSIDLDDICKCDLNNDYNYTDTSRKKYRYQAVFDIVHY